MSKPITDTAHKNNTIYWQQGNGEETVGEPALLVEWFSDSVAIGQQDSRISINYDTLPDLINQLRDLHKQYKTGKV